MFEYYNNILCVHASFLYNKEKYDVIVEADRNLKKAKREQNQELVEDYTQELKAAKYWYKKSEKTFLTVYNYKAKIRKNQLIKLTCGGNGRTALIEWDSVSPKLSGRIINFLGYDPAQKTKQNTFQDSIEQDENAIKFFNTYKKSDGEGLTDKQKAQYTGNANIFNAIREELKERTSKRNAHGKSITVFWKNLAQYIYKLDMEKFPRKLPKTPKRLRAAYKKYLDNEYVGLLHGGMDNDNSKKIKDSVADWWLAMYGLPIKLSIPAIMKKYNEVREENEWDSLSESAVKNFLDIPENARKWVITRHGAEEWKRRFGYYIKRKKDNWFPNCYWAIDGSKLDWIHFQPKTEEEKAGIAAKLKIDPTVDVFSEKIIGWSYSTTENHIDHFNSVKMAVNNTGAKPYLFTYDNQSGHKSKRMQELYSKIVANNGGIHYPNKARKHNSPVENIFKRLQQQVLNIMWFSDKQSPTVRTMNNKPNMEFINEFKHLLKTKEELMRAWEVCVKIWNNAPHPKFKHLSRNQVYEMEAPMREEFSFTDQIETFWIFNAKPITYKRGGIQIEVAKLKYEYEVLDSNEKIDLDFRKKYVGAKFYVKYDPEYLNDFIQLYAINPNGEKVFVANAQPKRAHESIPVLMQKGDKEAWNEDYKIVEVEEQRDLQDMRAIMERTGITPEKLIEEQELLIKMGGDLPKEQRQEVEEQSLFLRT